MTRGGVRYLLPALAALWAACFSPAQVGGPTGDAGVCRCVGKQCGNDGCGGTCGTCTAPMTCNAGGLCVRFSDKCQHVLCSTGETCDPADGFCKCTPTSCPPNSLCTTWLQCEPCENPCIAVDCPPATPVCVVGDNCTAVCQCRANPDRCGAGRHCVNGACVPCTPKTCAQQGFECGPAGDGCGGTIDCGTCTGHCQLCGVGGVPNACGSVGCCPMTCSDRGITCGPAGDGCGGLLQCGTCIAPQVCGFNGQCVTPVDYEWARWPVPPESPTNYTNGTDTVTDNVTGLIWQRAVPNQTYSWSDAKAHCAGLALGGRTGWRLPTLIELLSIVDSGTSFPSINSTAFPATPPVQFWASTPSGSAGDARYVYFHVGDSEYGPSATPYAVRCVWAPLPAAQIPIPTAGAPADQYTVGTETVFDNRTGLTWQRAVSAQFLSWTDSKSQCQALTLGGFSSDWRLPARKELETLLDFRAYPYSLPTIDDTAFPNMPATPRFFWTATPSAQMSDRAWWIYFDDGSSGDVFQTTSGNIRCVR